MTATILTAFSPQVTVSEHEDGSITIHNPLQTYTLKGVTPGLRQVIGLLASTGATQEQLTQLIRTQDSTYGLAVWFYHRQQLQAGHFLCLQFEVQTKKMATLLPGSSSFAFVPATLQPNEAYLLSRFAYIRRDEQQSGLLIDSPLSPARLLLHERNGLLLLDELSKPKTLQELTAVLPDSPEATECLLSALVAIGIVVTSDSEGNTSETLHPALPYWEFHDLLFHSRSRSGRHDFPIGGTYRFGQDDPPFPAIKRNMSDDTVDLYRPDIDQLTEHDLPFTHVLETRRSTRAFDHDQPVTIHQLGEFLYRVGRTRQLRTTSTASPYELSNRPYPSSGALYELEIYLVIHSCQGLSQGLYQYNSLTHQLCKVTDYNEGVRQLLQTGFHTHRGTQQVALPQVLLLISSRFPRLSWKYESLAYAATLKNTGVLYQTMYLVATAMGLSGTAIGCGDSDLFAKVTGLDYYAESLVGEFILGTPAP